MDETLEMIIENTGRKPVSCSCSECQQQCKTPCLGTPDDIINLIKVGYAKKLEMYQWDMGLILGELPAPVTVYRPKKTESGCIFFKNGLCELHEEGLKPTEGKLSHHTIKLDNFIFDMSLSWNVAREWMRLENLPKIVRLLFYMEVFAK